MNKKAPQYWLVGANWSGEDKADAFYNRGYWEIGWSDEDQPAYAALRSQIRPGDRLAIKALRGRGASTVTIKALGIVKEVGADDRRVYVNWIVTELDREVESKGAYGTLHGPFVDPGDTDWINKAFRI